MLLLDALKTEPTAVGAAEVIAGENATPVSELPESWQAIARGESNTRLSDAQVIVKMAQLFHYKLSHGDVDLFSDHSELLPPELSHPELSNPECSNPELSDSELSHSERSRIKGCVSELFGQLADETLSFYGEDFRVRRYPDFDTVFRELERELEQATLEEKQQSTHRFNVARIGIDLFSEFGYDVPASFYHVHLAPLYRDHVFEERALRFDPRDQNHKRPWDAVLHAGKVFAVQAKIQSTASQYGLTYQHGCGCDSHISAIDEAAGAFEYNLNTPKRDRWLRSYIWTMWYEYAFFGLIPNTAYLTKSARAKSV